MRNIGVTGLTVVLALMAMTMMSVGALAQVPAVEPACGGPGVCKKAWYGGSCPTCYARPYATSSCLYGYQDYVYGRGPLIDLGSAALEPGFRGYGVFGSPGYGVGLRPSSVIDTRANKRGLRLMPW